MGMTASWCGPGVGPSGEGWGGWRERQTINVTFVSLTRNARPPLLTPRPAPPLSASLARRPAPLAGLAPA
ncbi:hypothetical protein GCM10023324_08730 [Streptomyces youssoufiensis]